MKKLSLVIVTAATAAVLASASEAQAQSASIETAPAASEAASTTTTTTATATTEPTWAARYSDQSLSTLGTLTVGSSVVLGRDAQSSSFGIGAELRWVRSGWALSPRLSSWLGVANQTFAGTSGNVVMAGVAPALFAGIVRPVAERMNLGAMIGYELSYQGVFASSPASGQLSHSASLEALLTVHLGRSAFLEPRLRASYSHTEVSGASVGSAGGTSASGASIDRVSFGLSVQGGYVF